MKIFMDTAILEEIEQAKSYGLLEGVTTNPSLMKKAVEALKKKGGKIDLENYIQKILIVAKGKPVSLEVTTATCQGMAAEGKALFRRFNPVAKNVVIKIPVNPVLEEGAASSFDGLRAIRELSQEKIPVNCTLIFTPEQALLAAKAGAAYVSPFAGRIDDMLRKRAGVKFGKSDYYPAEGMERGGKLLEDNGIVSGAHLVRECVEILRKHNLAAEVIAASLRNPRQVREAALAGAQIGTMPFDVLQGCIGHEKTAEGMKAFTADVVKEYADIAKKK